MKLRVIKKGFTLIEMLAAMAIVVSIVSMVYGSYFATSKSAQAYKARMTASEDARSLLEQMARQIRCSYAKSPEPTPAATQELPKTQGILEKQVNYFKGGPDPVNGEILHLVTTARYRGLDDLKDGLFDVVYKFDENTHTLLVNRRRFLETPTALVEDRDFSPVIETLENIELAFFDGLEWLEEWDYSQKKSLPRAVRISIACEDENGRKFTYTAVPYIHCLRNQGKEEEAK